MDPARFEAGLAGLERLHARPAGGMLLAHPAGFPEAYRDFTYVMERELTR
jgi:hypothetical protein